jgi:hypothetical protein
MDAGQGEDACRTLQTVQLTRERLFGPDDYKTLRVSHLLGMFRHKVGDLNGAREIQRETLNRMRVVYGLDEQTTMSAMVNLANTLRDLRDYPELVVLDEEIVRAREEIYGPHDKRVRQSMAAFARTLRDMGRIEKAKEVERAMLDRALKARVPWLRNRRLPRS